MTKHLIGWFLISFSGEFVIDMVFDKKVKSLKTRFGISIVNGISLLLGALHTHQCIYFLYGLLIWWAVLFIEAGAELISKLFYSNQ
ncbi:hypothetical protein ID0081_12100 [Helicobacter pylori]